MAMAIVVGNVIGSGIFAKPGGIAAEAGDFRMILAAWIAGGLICILGALCYAELVVMLPRAGGAYVYLREAYGRLVGFLYGWNDFLFGRPASIGALATIFVGSLMHMLGRQSGAAEQLIVALSTIALMAGINIAGVIWGGRMQGATTLIKASFLAFVALLPLGMWLLGKGGVDAANFSTVLSGASGGGAGRFAVVLLMVMWAYDGWEGVTPVAEEIREPQRNIPRALFGGLGLLIVLYLAANLAYHAVLPMEAMAAAGDHAAEAVVKALLGPLGEKLMAAGVVLSTFGAINSNMLLGPRVSFAMGRDDVFFRQLGRVHVNYRTPATAIVVQALMASALVIASAILVQTVPYFADRSIFDVLTSCFVVSASVFYFLGVLSVFVLRFRRPEWERPYRTLGYPLTPAAYLAFYTWFLGSLCVDRSYEAAIGACLIGLGVPAYYGWRAWARRHPQHA